MCTPKESGGLGLKRLISWNKVFALKLLWLLFTKAGSLWVSWIRLNLIGHRNFWDLNPYNAGSWIWKRLCKLHSLARPFLVCEVGSGITASFWHDNWTGLGPLLDLMGPLDPQVIGLPKKAVVRDAISGAGWRVMSSSSRNPIISLIKNALSSCNDSISSEVDDVYLWKMDHRPPSLSFSSALTWQVLHPSGRPVVWHKSVWFKNHIPKHTFIAWVTAWNWLHTRDRMRRWGLSIPPDCVLWSGNAESREHLFFSCGFSSAVWGHFLARNSLSPPLLFMDCFTWVSSPSRDPNISLIIKLVFQASIYLLWKERNRRLHDLTA